MTTKKAPNYDRAIASLRQAADDLESLPKIGHGRDDISSILTIGRPTPVSLRSHADRLVRERDAILGEVRVSPSIFMQVGV